MTKTTLQKINKLLVVVICIFLLYIVVAPYLPEVTHFVQVKTDPHQGYKYASALAVKDGLADGLQPIPFGPQLTIPKIGVDGKINMGSDISELLKGIWHRPNSSTPDKGGNTVLVAHRWMYTEGGNTFYHLPKLEVGDKFSIFWQGKEYDYQVFESKEFPANAIEIEANTTEPIVTLYTCTPLWTATNRYVVKANLIKQV